MTLKWLPVQANTGSMIVAGLVTVVVTYLLVKIIKFIPYFRFFQALPGVSSYSLIFGNIHMIPKDGEGRIAFCRELMDNHHGKYARIWWGPFWPNLVVYHPETVKVILKSSEPKPRGFGQSYELAIPWIGEGLIVSNGATWARARRLLTPAFHFDVLKHYVEVYNQAVDTLIEKLDKLADSGESFDVCPMITLCTLEIILKCAMSYDVDVQRQGNLEYARAVNELLEGWSTRSRTPYIWPDCIFYLTPSGRRFLKSCNYVHNVAEEIIDKRRQLLEKEGQPEGRRLDFLDILLMARDEDGHPMTTLEIRNEVDTFMFAGHDTTAAGVPWILYTLAQSPEYQAKVQAELDAVLHGRDTHHIQWSDLANLQTLQLCIKESLRLYPPVPFTMRELTQPTEIDGKTIPPGTLITTAIVNLHRNSLVWQDPDVFWPERFLPENLKDVDSFSFNFALNEEKVLIARILHRYKVELAPDAAAVQRSATVILKSDNGIWLRFKRR
ncbi:unnamed protein product [Candidula unifasciata]|uniref:Cytochrome P450 n=1 Tax=Candidula unifasciata TaxID=100452 RepID=A0A8S3Z9I9_9EUPU|nr:unnamed protein product [Candidula unifasciata]